MTSYKVLNWDFNSKEVEHYDIMPYFINEYMSTPKSNRPKTFEGFKDFIERWGKYRFWSRCEYEIIISQWPPEKDPMKHAKKIDIWQQIEMNLNVVTNILMENINELHN